jgi:FlaA1/EpsC-like NDP-sugar epimerase
MAEGGDVFVLDMGKLIRIGDLARRMINLAGLTVRDEQHPEGDIEISTRPASRGEALRGAVDRQQHRHRHRPR